MGEKCQWQFARKTTLGYLLAKDVASGSLKVTESRLAHQKKHLDKVFFLFAPGILGVYEQLLHHYCNSIR